MIIEAKQYLFPNGEQRTAYGEVSDDLKPQWTALTAAGLVLEMEVLPRGADSNGTQLVHITFTDPDRGDYQTRLVPNDMDLLLAVADMIRRFDPEDLGSWRVLWDAEAEEAAQARNDDFMRSIDGDGDEC